MLPIAGLLPVSKENEQKYLDICSQFRNRSSKTIWSPLFHTDTLDREDSTFSSNISDFYITEISDGEIIEDGLRFEGLVRAADESWVRRRRSLDAGVADSQDHHETAVLADCVSQEKLIAIKDALMNENVAIDPSPLRNIPAYLIENFFNEINISQSTVLAVRAFLDQILNMDPPIGLNIATAVIRHALFPRVLENEAHRNLTNVTLNFCEKYSSGVVEGLLMPLMQSDLKGSFQVEMITSIFNSMKLQENDYRKIREKLDVVVPSASTFYLLAFLIGVQNFMDDQAFDVLIKKLKEWSAFHNSDLKFSSLLMKVITAFGKKASDMQLSLLEEIVMSNKSSFKALASRELNKLRK